MPSINKNRVTLRDRVTGYEPDIVLEDGIKKIATTKLVQIESLAGKQRAATNYFYINTVSDGETLTIDIDATDTAPAFNETFTVGVSETKFEFAERIELELNQDFVNFQPYYKAIKVDDNAIIFIEAKNIAEAGENATANSFQLSGTVDYTLAFDDLIRRGSTVQASLSSEDPRLAVFGISGTVESRSADVSGLLIVQPYHSGVSTNISMKLDGSVTPIEYTFPMDSLNDYFISEIKFFGLDNGIQFGTSRFLGINTALTNGIQIEIKTDNNVITFPLIKTTQDFDDKFAFGTSDLQVFFSSGDDKFTASFLTDSNPFPLRRSGTFGTGNDDYIKIRIRDDLTSISQFQAIVQGVKREA